METTIRMVGSLDPRGSWGSDHCPIAASLDVVRTRSAFLILREAFYGTSHFDDFAERAGISEPVCAARLRELTEQGLLRRERYRQPGQRARDLYRLTPKGADFFPALAALMQWGDRWLEQGSRVELRHRDCGERVEARLRCRAGHEVEVDQLDLKRKG